MGTTVGVRYMLVRYFSKIKKMRLQEKQRDLLALVKIELLSKNQILKNVYSLE